MNVLAPVRDIPTAAEIHSFFGLLAFRLIFILTLCTAGVSKSVRCHAHGGWGVWNLGQQTIIFGSYNARKSTSPKGH